VSGSRKFAPGRRPLPDSVLATHNDFAVPGDAPTPRYLKCEYLIQVFEWTGSWRWSLSRKGYRKSQKREEGTFHKCECNAMCFVRQTPVSVGFEPKLRLGYQP